MEKLQYLHGTASYKETNKLGEGVDNILGGQGLDDFFFFLQIGVGSNKLKCLEKVEKLVIDNPAQFETGEYAVWRNI